MSLSFLISLKESTSIIIPVMVVNFPNNDLFVSMYCLCGRREDNLTWFPSCIMIVFPLFFLPEVKRDFNGNLMFVAGNSVKLTHILFCVLWCDIKSSIRWDDAFCIKRLFSEDVEAHQVKVMRVRNILMQSLSCWLQFYVPVNVSRGSIYSSCQRLPPTSSWKTKIQSLTTRQLREHETHREGKSSWIVYHRKQMLSRDSVFVGRTARTRRRSMTSLWSSVTVFLSLSLSFLLLIFFQSMITKLMSDPQQEQAYSFTQSFQFYVEVGGLYDYFARKERERKY